MNPAEEIVKFWLESKGYFTQSSIRLPKNKEIDILTIGADGEKAHVEVSVSVRMANYDKNAAQLAAYFCERKFLSIADEVQKRLGKDYKKKLVVGRVSKSGKDIFDEFLIECQKLGIQVLKFENIIKEIAPTLLTHTYLNPIVKTFQLMNEFLGIDQYI